MSTVDSGGQRGRYADREDHNHLGRGLGFVQRQGSAAGTPTARITTCMNAARDDPRTSSAAGTPTARITTLL